MGRGRVNLSLHYPEQAYTQLPIYCELENREICAHLIINLALGLSKHNLIFANQLCVVLPKFFDEVVL